MATQKINGVYHVSNTQQGGGGGSDPEAVKYTPQTLTEAQKSQARTNIGAADEINGITSATASVDNTTGTPSVSVNLSNQQLSLAFSGLKGAQGNTGSSVDYPYELVNNVTTDDATKGLSAAQGVVLQGEIDQLGQEVHTLSGKYYGLFTSSAILPSEITQPGYAFVGSSTPFAIWNFDGSAWTDTGATVDTIHGEDGVGFQSVASQQDGTIVITLTNGDTVTIDLNHDHPAYPKYELMEDEAEYQAIATKESDKLYLIPEV